MIWKALVFVLVAMLLSILIIPSSTDAQARPTPIPDSDGDGLPDNVDNCPFEKGPRENGGCPVQQPPDRDLDTIPDDRDQCPDVYGPGENNGCPFPTDSDGDGLFDDQDQCPGIAGARENNGCPPPTSVPVTDRDGDGLPDNTDGCPNTAGPRSNNGCPVTPTPEPQLPADGPCVVAALGASVNLHSYASSADPWNTIGQLAAADPTREVYLKLVLHDIMVSSVKTADSSEMHEGEIELFSFSLGAAGDMPYLTIELENTLITSYSLNTNPNPAGEHLELASWSWGISQQPGALETWYLVDTPDGLGWVLANEIRLGGDCNNPPLIELTPDSTTAVINRRVFGLKLLAAPPTFGDGADGSLTLELDCDIPLQKIVECDGSVFPFDRNSEAVTVPFLDGHAKVLRAPTADGDAVIAFVAGNVDLMLILGSLPDPEGDEASNQGSIMYGLTPGAGSQSDVVPTESLSLNFALVTPEETGMGCSINAPVGPAGSSAGLSLACTGGLPPDPDIPAAGGS